jgi:hypothetical protein
MAELDDERTPTWRATLDRAVRAGQAVMHTSIPAVVQSYDAATQRATVQPCIKRRLGNGDTFDYPPLVDVPVQQLSTAGYALHLPVAQGTEGVVHFAERSIDEWLIEGGTGVEAADPRRFDEQDGYFVPGHLSSPQALPAAARPADALCIGTRDGSVRIEVRAGGVVTIFATEVRLGNDTALPLAIADLVDARVATIRTAFNAHTHLDSTGAPTSSPATPIPSQASTAASRAKGV